MNIFVINAGSSSLKYQLIDMEFESVLASGIVERIGIDGTALKHQANGRDIVIRKANIIDHNEAVNVVVQTLLSKENGVIASIDDIDAVGFRIAHGGERFSDATLIDDLTIEAIKEYSELAPLHNPVSIVAIEACKRLMTSTPMVAVFDTAFHQTLPKKAFLYGLSYDAYTELKIRRYGFHGPSHKYMAMQAAKALGKDTLELKLITCHLGNGSSVSAIRNGRSFDTSMGFTPLEGFVMGTRCGDIDPAIVQYLMKKKDMSIDGVMDYLNAECGVLGLSGKSSDFRDLWKHVDNGDERSLIAIEVFCYRVKKYIGAYTAAMNGVDAIVFAGGIGENDTRVREMIADELGFLGIELDIEQNKERGVQKVISTPNSKVAVLVVRANEELMIARDTLGICAGAVAMRRAAI